MKLAADVYLPVKRERVGQEMAVAGPEGRVPTVLVRTPYGKRVGAETYYRYVQRGYAVVIQDVRGREDSEGEWLPMHYEVEDGDDTLNWIADQKWSDGKVAMTGGSYLGYVQWAAAASENPHLTAMLSSVCAGSPFVDLPRRGGCFNSGSMSWAFMVSGQRSDASLMGTGRLGRASGYPSPGGHRAQSPGPSGAVLKEMAGPIPITTISGKWATGRSGRGPTGFRR